MKNDDELYYEGSRSKKRAKRRKTNLILNSLIVIVLLLIIFVSARIFMGTDDSAAKDSGVAADSSQASGKESGDTASGDSSPTDAGEAASQEETDESANDADNNEADSETEEDSEETVTDGGSGPNVKRTIENPGWKPVGTTQTGEHVSSSDTSSADWKEKEKALAYAAGLDPANMTIWWLESNGDPNRAIGTVTEKGGDQAYRIYLEWLDGEGWKPVKMEELIENDKD